MTRSFKELPTSLAIAGVHPLDTAKLTGFVAVSPTPGVGVKTESFDGLTEIPAVSLPDYATLAGSGNVLAYKFISAEPKSVPEWQLSVATEAVAAWVRAEVVNTFTFTETLVSGRALVRYDIANAPVKELRVKVPAEFKNVEISGPNIRSKEFPREHGGTSYTSPHNSNASPSNGGQSGTRAARPSEANDQSWRVELQSPVQGFYTLTVTWDQPRPANTERAGNYRGVGGRRGTRDRPAGRLGPGAVAGERIERGGFAARGHGRFSRLGRRTRRCDGAGVSLRAAGLPTDARRAAV